MFVMTTLLIIKHMTVLLEYLYAYFLNIKCQNNENMLKLSV